MFAIIDKKMRNPPIWKHLRDLWDFQGAQPDFLTPKVVKGMPNPHHIRISWSSDGTICLQNKAWMTSTEWEPPMRLCDQRQVKQLRALWPLPLTPNWPDGFESSSLRWLDKLKLILSHAQRPTDGIDHCMQLVRHELPEFLPSRVHLAAQLTKMRIGEATPPPSSGPQTRFEAFG